MPAATTTAAARPATTLTSVARPGIRRWRLTRRQRLTGRRRLTGRQLAALGGLDRGPPVFIRLLQRPRRRRRRAMLRRPTLRRRPFIARRRLVVLLRLCRLPRLGDVRGWFRLGRGRGGAVHQRDLARAAVLQLADPPQPGDEAWRAGRPAEPARLERVGQRIERDG